MARRSPRIAIPVCVDGMTNTVISVARVAPGPPSTHGNAIAVLQIVRGKPVVTMAVVEAVEAVHRAIPARISNANVCPNVGSMNAVRMAAVAVVGVATLAIPVKPGAVSVRQVVTVSNVVQTAVVDLAAPVSLEITVSLASVFPIRAVVEI